MSSNLQQLQKNNAEIIKNANPSDVVICCLEEDKKGRIQKGMLADFVVLSENLFEIPKDKIKDIKVLETYLGGKKVK